MIFSIRSRKIGNTPRFYLKLLKPNCSLKFRRRGENRVVQ